MLKRPWWMLFTAAGIAAVIGLMSGGGVRTTLGKSTEAGNTRGGSAGLDRPSGTNSNRQPANPADDETENSGPRQSSRHATGDVEKNRLQQEQRKLAEKIQLQSQLDSLLKYDDAQLAVYAAGLDLPGNTVREIHPRYLEAKRHHEDLKKRGLGDVHPTVKAQKATLDELGRELDEGVVSLREALTAQLKALEDRPPKATD